MASKEHYLRASEELSSGSVDRALWAQAVSNAMGVTEKEAAIYVQLRAEELERLERSQRAVAFAHTLSKKASSAADRSRKAIAIFVVAFGALIVLHAAWEQGAKHLELKRLKSQLIDAEREREEVLASQQCKDEQSANGDPHAKLCVIGLNLEILSLSSRIRTLEHL